MYVYIYIYIHTHKNRTNILREITPDNDQQYLGSCLEQFANTDLGYYGFLYTLGSETTHLFNSEQRTPNSTEIKSITYLISNRQGGEVKYKSALKAGLTMYLAS